MLKGFKVIIIPNNSFSIILFGLVSILSITIGMGSMSHADIIHDTITPTGNYGADWQIQNIAPTSDLAGKFFVSTTDYYLDTITMRIKDNASNSPDSISLWIAENSANNLPSSTAVLSKEEFTSPIPDSYSNIVFDPVEAPILEAGNYYWLVATVEDAPAGYGYAWNSNLSYSPGSNLAARPIGGNWSIIIYDPFAFQISGTEVPIPGAIWLLGSGFIGLVGLRRKLTK